MKYKTSELAKEWGVSPEAVRRYIREIKQDQELLSSGLIEDTKAGVLITEAGKEWIDNRRTHWKETVTSGADDQSTKRLLERIEELETREAYYKERITYYERHSEELLNALTRQQYLALSYTQEQQESPPEANSEPHASTQEDNKNKEEAEQNETSRKSFWSWLHKKRTD